MAKEKQRNIEGVARRATNADKKFRDKLQKTQDKIKSGKPVNVGDSFVNFAQKMGVGADNPLSTAGYGFNPITRIRTQLEWIHRGSWLGGMAVDLPAEDMTRAGIDIESELKPEKIEEIQEEMVNLKVWKGLRDTMKWGRLYGGAGGVLLVDGQNYSTPLLVERIGKGQFKGILPLDRWMMEPSLNDLITEAGPEMGLPKFYRVISDAPALNGVKIHHSRIIRMIGVEVPYYQRVMENLWGISVLERLFDRMVAFDSATTGAAQLIYKCWIRTYAIKDLRAVVAAGGPAMQGMLRYVEMMRRFQGIEGITLLDGEDKMENMQHSAFGGLSDVMLQFGQQLSGALQIPLVRLFGQSPAGLNATGESDLRMYYDNINKTQESDLRTPVTLVVRCVAASKGILLPNGTRVTFRSLWQLTDKEKAEIAEITERAVGDAEEKGLISQKGAMKELQQSSHVTGIFTNITDDDIEAAEETLPPAGAVAAEQALAASAEEPSPAKKAQDSIASIAGLKAHHDLDVIIEHSKGQVRRGIGWEATLAADYGYVRRTKGADGEPVDCFVGPNPASDKVWVIGQQHIDGPLAGTFDEFKCMLGFEEMHKAVGAYVGSYSDNRGMDRINNMQMFSAKQFKEWLAATIQ